jgi:Cro/C1-type HTH DNA-binding domain
MSKTLITIPEGNLQRVAATQSITTLTALKEKTGVDRKTLRAINAGQPVKETTLQSIADNLRVPLAHLRGPTPDKSDDVSGVDVVGFDGCRIREIKLKQLDGTALRGLAGETEHIAWFLKIDQISEELEALLLKLRNSLKGLFFHVLIVEDPGMDDLENQISQIKTSADIDEIIEELAVALMFFGQGDCGRRPIQLQIVCRG